MSLPLAGGVLGAGENLAQGVFSWDCWSHSASAIAFRRGGPGGNRQGGQEICLLFPVLPPHDLLKVASHPARLSFSICKIR